MISRTADWGFEVEKNMAMWDRVVRAVVGVILLSLVFLGPQTAWGWLGLIPLATVLVGWCPAYSLFGIRTKKAQGSGSNA